MDRGMDEEPATEYRLDPDVLAIAARRSEEDMALLARLLRESKVRRDRPPEGLRREADALDAEVDRLNGKRQVNLAIRPRKRRR